MLPDFGEFKAYARDQLLRWMRNQVPTISPILGEIRHFAQHEGRKGVLTRADRTIDPMEQSAAHVTFQITPEEMKTFDVPSLQKKLLSMAEQLSEQQSSTLFKSIAQAAESVGNTVNAQGDFQPRHFLELLEKVDIDFDPKTGEIAPGFSFVMHPDTAESVMKKVSEWEKDPGFIAAHKAVMDQKKKNWNDRENRRTLVD